MANAARAVIGPDHPATPVRIVVISGVVGIVVGAVEVPVPVVEVRPIGVVTVISAITEAAAVKDGSAAKASAMERYAATMEGRASAKTTAVESWASTAMEGRSSANGSATSAKSSTASADVSTAATTRTGTAGLNLNDRRIRQLLRSRPRAGTDQRHRLC